MLEIIYYVASSLDGYIATADGGVGWLEEYQGAGEDYGFREIYGTFDAIVMGSHTYEFALAHPPWQAPDKPSWVFTRRELPIAHPSVTLTDEDPSRLVESLGASGLNRLWLMGGGELATSFRMQGLITCHIVSVIPIVLGGGIPLFADAPRRDSLELVETKRFSRGIVQLTYEMRPDA